MGLGMTRPSPLDDPANARNAWARYRQLMKWMTLLSVAAVIVALVALRLSVGTSLTIHMMIATALGIGGAVLLTAALMGLVFMSSGSGHDESIDDPFADIADR
jgi:heme O synthase-like polyprenyltransferase